MADISRHSGVGQSPFFGPVWMLAFASMTCGEGLIWN